MEMEELMAMAWRFELRPRRRAFAWVTWEERGFRMDEFVWTARRLGQLADRCRERGCPFEVYLDVNGEPACRWEGSACGSQATA